MIGLLQNLTIMVGQGRMLVIAFLYLFIYSHLYSYSQQTVTEARCIVSDIVNNSTQWLY